MNHKICPLPFSQIFIQSSGRVYPCSFLQNHTLIGDVKKNSINDIWNGENLKSFREEHLKGKCEQCAKNQKTFNCHKSLEWTKEHSPEKKKDPPLKRIDFMIDSKCNLVCIMCTNIYEQRGGFNSESFWSDAQENTFPYLEEIEIIGGEPFISRDTYKLIDKVNKVNPNCRWKITTNGAYNLGKKIKQTIQSIKLHTLAFSIDSLNEETFQEIRRGGSLKQTLKTLDEYINYNDGQEERKKFLIECNFVVQQKNAYEVPDFLDFCKSKRIVPYLIFLNNPPTHSIISSPLAEQVKIFLFYLKNLKSKFHPELYKISLDLFKKLPSCERIKYAEELYLIKEK